MNADPTPLRTTLPSIIAVRNPARSGGECGGAGPQASLWPLADLLLALAPPLEPVLARAVRAADGATTGAAASVRGGRGVCVCVLGGG